MMRMAFLCVCVAALAGLGGCGSSSTVEAAPTQLVVSGFTVTLNGQETGDQWLSVAGLGGGVEPVETIDGASGEARYAPGQVRWNLLRLTRDYPGPADDVVQQWINDSFAGKKPQGLLQILIRDSQGADVSSWNIERWHIESFTIPPFNAKGDSDLTQEVTIRLEKLSRS